MILRTKGAPLNLDEFLVLKVTRFKHKAYNPDYCWLVDKDQVDFSALEPDLKVITSKRIEKDCKVQGKLIHSIKSLDHLSEDDIVYMGIDGNLRTLYRKNSNQNYILVTERCNSNCLMCSQPPKDRDDIDFLHSIHLKLIPIIPKDCVELGITGGEPTALGSRLFELLGLITKELPNTEIHILTNGRGFAINALAKKLSDVKNPRIMLGIPLYSDSYQIHDYVVQAKDAYYQTVMGIQNLKRYGIRIEIRVVLHKITIPRLSKLSQFLYRNMPYVNHITFMGLEIMGFTKANLNDLWIEPVDYMEELNEAVSYLARRKLNVSIYNTPLCLLPLGLWSFNRNSISDWKNVYFEECKKCVLKNECGGLFASAHKKASENIKAFEKDPRKINPVHCDI